MDYREILAVAFGFLIVLVPLLVLSIPLLAIWTHHRRKMAEMRAQRDLRLSEAVQAEFASVRAEIQTLRDTSMQYDLSFDTNLRQLERRMDHVERQGFSARSAPEDLAQNRRY